MASVIATDLGKSFGHHQALSHISLVANSGEFIALLGPSGCGKTTLLRLLAGFERPDHGSIELGEVLVAGRGIYLPPEKRNIGMVFQSYALWPHMTVAENVGFALSVRGTPGAERRKRVAEALELVGLSAYATRRPAQLSGGQRQRVALARCLAMRPPVILLDEPLANLDAHLRETMQHEFRRLNRELGSTFIYVTHDHAEAMSLADRVLVMSGGEVQQLAAPVTLYREPATRMVAEFIGGSMVLPVRLRQQIDADYAEAELWQQSCRLRGTAQQTDALACFRPGDFELLTGTMPTHPMSSTAGRVMDVIYRGGSYLALVQPEASDAPALRIATETPPQIGAPVGFKVRDGWILPPENLARLQPV
ncbi:MAG TPA: ABC transporter ATP-binding protein [Dongiaceae bacterium]|nr:ABC transporter ATP-binding protein [Dongiaceae bacterium]